MKQTYSCIRGTFYILFLIVMVGSVTACSRSNEKVILQREWIANAEFAGDVWAATASRDDGLIIDIREGSEAVDPIRTVRSGEAQVGVASSDRVLRENEGGAGLVILAAATYKSPVVFLSHPADAINSPRDFRGRVVGIQTGTNTELVFKSLLLSQRVVPSDMRVVESGWGTKNFETGTIAILGAFDYDEPVQLRRKSVPFRVLYPEQYGVQYVGTVYFTSRAYLDAHADIIQRFMDKLVAGWQQALTHPGSAIERLKNKFHRVDAAKERESLTRGALYFRGENGELLYASRSRWEAMAKNLRDLKLLKSFNFDQNVDYRFLESALRKARPT